MSSASPDPYIDPYIDPSATPAAAPSPGGSNIYLSGSLPLLFAKTAMPIIVVMGVNGLFTLVDAYFLGVYVGADALTAVTLMFPLYMLLVALSTWVSSGFSSIFARLLGADEQSAARELFGQALLLSLLVCGLLVGLFLIGGQSLTLWAANGSTALAGMGYTYISILIFCAPLVFVLAINIDALRCEGLLPAMAAITLTSALLNIGFDYLFIAVFGWGVAGSAYGTVAAQICSLLAIVGYRTLSGHVRNRVLLPHRWSYFGELLALGAPSSLGYIGISLSAGLTLYCLQLWAGQSYEATAGAFGIITRLMTFAFLPLLGLSMAFQTIVGNNFGAKLWARSNSTLKLALVLAFTYCALAELTFLTTRFDIGFVFIDDAEIASEIARILPYAVMLMFVFGPLMMIGTYFQAIGAAGHAALLGLSRTYLFALPLTFALPFWFGEPGIWYAGIVAEICVLMLTLVVLRNRQRRHGQRLGLLEHPA
ncbi:MATE family efflux transporter [Pararhizobium sp. IMCC21322]|uniref:MATE family efflux transporter n=1 Tax=Pararhizobium sp. IMCC21322 TaxID=3067903 RepID=UPI0027416AB0|nr:MATE family efflux transporter [Pararhizobium sp. IMCC21322]